MSEQFLSPENRRKLIGIVAGLYDFTDGGPRGRREFIQNSASLGRFVPGIDLSGSPRTVAGDLVGRLEQYGRLPERPTYHALGALLDAVMGVGELERDKATFVAGVIVRYSLVADPTYMARLRENYGVTGDVVVEAPPEVVAPLVDSSQVAKSPDFAPAISDDDAKERYPDGWDSPLPYIRVVPDPTA